MSFQPDLPYCKDPHITAKYGCTIANHFNTLAMEDHSNLTQIKESVMTAAAETISKIV